MDLIIRKIYLEGNNVVFKNLDDDIVAAIPSHGTSATVCEQHDNIIHIKRYVSTRDPHDFKIPISVENIIVPVGSWNRNTLIQELSDNYLNQAITVTVTNPTDLSTVESLLTDIKGSTSNIDDNTDNVETQLDTIIADIKANGLLNHSDLLNVISELQKIDSNTDDLESQLTDIIANTSTNATEATLAAIKLQTDKLIFVDSKLRTTGEDGGGGGTSSIVGVKNVADEQINPSTDEGQQAIFENQGTAVIAAPFGSGILGWLRGIYEILFSGIITKPVLNTDGVGRLRISDLSTLIDLKQIDDGLPLFYDTELVDGGVESHSVQYGGTIMDVFNGVDAVIRQTKQKFNCQTGKSMLVTCNFDSFQSESDVVKRIGYFNSSPSPLIHPKYDGFKDGTYLESAGGSIFTVVEAEGSIMSKTSQSNWNVDKLNGTGQSGLFIDWSSRQSIVFEISSSSVRFYIQYGGAMILFHQDIFNNSIQGIFMKPNHSIRYEIRSEGGMGEMVQGSASVAIEGLNTTPLTSLSFNNGFAKLDANTRRLYYPVIGVKIKENHNNTIVEELHYSVMGSTNDNFKWEIRANPTITGVFDYVDQTNAPVYVAYGDKHNELSGGRILASGYSYNRRDFNIEFKNAIKLGIAINGDADEFVLCVMPTSDGLDIYSSLTIKTN